MRKVVVGAMVSMDGVMQAPGGPEEDPTGGFTFGGWVAPLADVDPVFGAEIGKLFGEPFDLLLGRRTYDIFAAHWPYAEGGPYDDIARAFNQITKYVATHKGADLTWKGSVALRDAAKDVAKLKHEDGPMLVTQGSTELVHALLENDLVDEMNTLTVPIVLGGGKKLFADGSAPHSYRLTRSRSSGTGIIVAHYERDGEIRIGDTASEQPSEAERARQERMKREG